MQDLNSKQRAYLRKLANPIDSIIQVGKQGTAPELVSAVDEALEARELIKLSVLNNCDESPREVADVLSKAARAECVQVIGKKVVLYRPNRENPVIKLPK